MDSESQEPGTGVVYEMDDEPGKTYVIGFPAGASEDSLKETIDGLREKFDEAELFFFVGDIESDMAIGEVEVVGRD